LPMSSKEKTPPQMIQYVTNPRYHPTRQLPRKTREDTERSESSLRQLPVAL
jgi:hypothetical protein